MLGKRGEISETLKTRCVDILLFARGQGAKMIGNGMVLKFFGVGVVKLKAVWV